MTAIAQAQVARPGGEVGVGAGMRTRLAWWMALAAGLGFAAAGLYTVGRGFDARAEVRAQLLAENITTPEDAAIPNVRVADHVTAHAQADVIQKHLFEITDGKTYAQLDRDDPRRETAFQAAMLRTSLMSAALAWHTADLAIGVGAFIGAVGLLLIVGAALLRPGRDAIP